MTSVLQHCLAAGTIKGWVSAHPSTGSLPKQSQMPFKMIFWIFLVRLLKTMGNFWNRFLWIFWGMKLFLWFRLIYKNSALMIRSIFLPYTIVPFLLHVLSKMHQKENLFRDFSCSFTLGSSLLLLTKYYFVIEEHGGGGMCVCESSKDKIMTFLFITNRLIQD